MYKKCNKIAKTPFDPDYFVPLVVVGFFSPRLYHKVILKIPLKLKNYIFMDVKATLTSSD